MNSGMHDNTDLINHVEQVEHVDVRSAHISVCRIVRVFRVFKFLKFASNLKRASIGFFCLFVFPILALFRLKAANKQTGKEQKDER